MHGPINIRWVVKNSVVDANGMQNNHCEYDNVITFSPARNISSQFNFPFNGKPDADEPFTLMYKFQLC